MRQENVSMDSMVEDLWTYGGVRFETENGEHKSDI